MFFNSLFDSRQSHLLRILKSSNYPGSDSIAPTFPKRVASGLQTARSFVIPNHDEQASDTTDFELVTWLVIKAER